MVWVCAVNVGWAKATAGAPSMEKAMIPAVNDRSDFVLFIVVPPVLHK
jgi:hypothetical protein